MASGNPPDPESETQKPSIKTAVMTPHTTSSLLIFLGLFSYYTITQTDSGDKLKQKVQKTF